MLFRSLDEEENLWFYYCDEFRLVRTNFKEDFVFELPIEGSGDVYKRQVCGINDLQEEFDEHDSEIETVARECIAATVA